MGREARAGAAKREPFEAKFDPKKIREIARAMDAAACRIIAPDGNTSLDDVSMFYAACGLIAGARAARTNAILSDHFVGGAGAARTAAFITMTANFTEGYRLEERKIGRKGPSWGTIQ
ncbi:MAG: hypothetical protein RQ833_07390 [Sphingomonadaceae bacterium]|nr:hypothetical protein [Sphingomonadaceae bacterium]